LSLRLEKCVSGLEGRYNSARGVSLGEMIEK